MAGLHYAAATTTSLQHCYHRRPTFQTLHPRKPNLLICCFSTPFPTKRTRRKNYLREKILKTLEKPIIPKLPPADPKLPIDSSPLQEIKEFESLREIQEPGNEEIENFEELREVEVSVPDGVGVDGNKLVRDVILNYGLWFVGALVFQIVCAILFFDSADTDDENEILNGTEKKSALVLNGNGNGQMGIGNNAVASVGHVDELEMEKRIEEIRVMAREAREKERLESKKNSVESEEIDGGKDFKSEIEEEVDNRLIRLRKKLEKASVKKPVASKKAKDGFEKGELDEKESNGALLFKKKYKFKDLSSDPVEKPKGFVGSDNNGIKSGNLKEDELNRNRIGGTDVIGSELSYVHLVEEEKKKDMSETSESMKNTSKKVVKERRASKQGKGKGVIKPKAIDVEPNKLSKGNGSSKGKGFGSARSAVKNGSENGFWWSNLPYVLVIFMQRRNNGEVEEGLYLLNRKEDRTSHLVAFEDRTDATNFSYLLQSFFEELGDFNADVVPLTVKELNEAANLDAMRVIVVRRGQLHLYAGQPLEDAEQALRGMMN